MASSTIIPRFLLPQGELLFRPRALRPATLVNSQQPTYTFQSCRHASSKSSKPKVLEKPSRFNPPSHPQRLVRSQPRSYPGPPLSEAQLVAQKTKQYPNMFPPESSWMHWFLTNRRIHLWISLSVLSTFAFASFVLNFQERSPYGHMLPSPSDCLWRPVASIKQAFEVMKLHEIHTTEVTAERRKKKLEEAQKRKAYRVAHGLEKADGEGIEMGEVGKTVVGDGETVAVGEVAGADAFVDFEGKKRPIKKWLGIW